MNVRLLLFAGLCFYFTNCEKEPTTTTPPPDNQSVDLSNLKAGQKSIYERYTTVCDALGTEFKRTGDILHLEVLAEEGQLYFKESLTPESPLVIDGTITEPYTHKVNSEEEYILIPERAGSLLFYFYANDTIGLNPNHDVTLKQEDCRLVLGEEPFIGNDIGWLEQFEVGDVEQKNKTVISCEPFEDLDAYLFYDSKELFVSHVVTFGWAGNSVNGWVLKED